MEENDIKASDADRERVVTRLREAVSTGHLDLEEFSDRVDAALAAPTMSALAEITRDLPVAETGNRKSTSWILGILGGGDRAGRWRLAERLRVINLMGGADLDLRSAVISSPVTTITVFSLMGGSTIRVPDGIDVELSGFAFMGGNRLRLDGPPVAQGSPVLIVRAYAIMGGTEVRSERPSRRARRELERR